MKTAMGPKTDMELKNEVMAELKWEPSVNEAKIGVIVEDGVVTLTGTVENWAEKISTEQAVLRVAGVKAVANELEVELPSTIRRDDADIARDAASILQANTLLPRDGIKVSVQHGWITLRGQVEWQYQKKTAEHAVHYLKGVKGTMNEIFVKPRLAPSEIKSKIVAAIERSALLEAQGITVEAQDRKVILRGQVRSWTEKSEAEKAAWSAPGVAEVENNIRVVIT